MACQPTTSVAKVATTSEATTDIATEAAAATEMELFGKLIEDVPLIYEEFELPPTILEEPALSESDSELPELFELPVGGIHQDPFESDNDSGCTEIDSYSDMSWDDQISDSGYDGGISSSDDSDDLSIGYFINFQAINQNDLAWEEWVIASQTDQLMYNCFREWHWFYSQVLHNGTWQISRGYSNSHHNWP